MSYTSPISAADLSGTQFGLVWLALCSVSYAQQQNSDISEIASSISAAISGLPALPAPADAPASYCTTSAAGVKTITGSWNLDWGPAIDNDNSNLIYIASYRLPGADNNLGSPCFYAVVIRGTDMYSSELGLAQQVLQDLNAVTLSNLVETFVNLDTPMPGTVDPLPLLNSGSIASGSAGGFSILANLAVEQPLTKKNIVVAEALLNLVNASPGVPVIVTGHSLGGCQTQVMSCYLKWQLKGTLTETSGAIYPNPIAPPTAGDATFAKYYNNAFPNANFWYNELDVVPCAFADLSTISNFWQTYNWPTNSVNLITGEDISGTSGPTAPTVLTDLIKSLLGQEVNLLGYTRPSVGVQAMSNGLPTPSLILSLITEMNQAATSAASDTTTDIAIGGPGIVINTLPQQAMEGTAMLDWQHFPPCYYSLIQAVDGVLPYPYVDPFAIPVASGN